MLLPVTYRFVHERLLKHCCVFLRVGSGILMAESCFLCSGLGVFSRGGMQVTVVDLKKKNAIVIDG